LALSGSYKTSFGPIEAKGLTFDPISQLGLETNLVGSNYI